MTRSMLKYAVFGVIAAVAGCSSAPDDFEYYGYEEEFVYPEPDIIPSMPDDNPGLNVDQMLDGQKPEDLEQRAANAPVYEHEGRFGSKEKISLRKGLNAPVAGVEYAAEGKEPVSVVRPLELRPAAQAQPASDSGKTEEEILAEIVSPAQETVAAETVSETVVEDNGTVVEEEATAVVLTPPAGSPSAEKDTLPQAPSGEDGYSRQPPLSTFAAPQPAPAPSVAEPRPAAAPAAEIAAVPLIPPAAPAYQPLPPAPQPDFVLTPPQPQEQPFQLMPPAPAYEQPAPAYAPQETITLTPPSAAQAPAFELTPPAPAQAPAQTFELLPPPAAVQQPLPQAMPQDTGLGVSQNVAMISFPAGQTTLPAAASADITTAVFALRRQAFGRLLVIGYDAPNGKTGNVSVAQRRADAVSGALIRAGVAAAQIKTEAQPNPPYGEKNGNFAEIYLEY